MKRAGLTAGTFGSEWKCGNSPSSAIWIRRNLFSLMSLHCLSCLKFVYAFACKASELKCDWGGRRRECFPTHEKSSDITDPCFCDGLHK